ncbi:MAG: hypothetical protein AAF788_05715 [Pseudomonadota bacterium]
MRIFALLALLVVAACLVSPVDTTGPYYGQGFTDGCRTAEARKAAFDTRVFRDESLFSAQDSYQRGWRAGFSECRVPNDVGLQPTDEGRLDNF